MASSRLLRAGHVINNASHRRTLALGRSSATSPLQASAYTTATTANPAALTRLLDHHNHDTRAGLRALFKDDLFRPRYNVSLDEERELAYQRLSRVCNSGLFSVRDFWTNPRNIFAVHEECGRADGSLATKLTVQCA